MILAWFKAKWAVILTVFIVVATFGLGIWLHSIYVDATLKKQAEQDIAELTTEVREFKQKYQEAQQESYARRKRISALSRELNNAYDKNPSNASCVPSPERVRILQRAVKLESPKTTR